MTMRTVSTCLTFLLLLAGGCSNAGEGALTGAGVGALSGLAIGSLTGEAGKGAAIGAVVGGVGGAVIGDQNRRKEEAAQKTSQQQQPPPQVVVQQPPPAKTTTVVTTTTYQTGTPLGRLIGNWRISGSIDAGNGVILPITGSATGAIDKVYFVRLDCRMTDPRNGQTVEGTSIISQTGDRGVELTNSFSTSPVTKRFQGQMDPSGTVFSLSQVSPAGSSRQIVIRMSAGPGFTAEMWDNGKRMETLTFSPA